MPKWPDNRTFAFTVFDDPDSQTLSGVRRVYDLLSNTGLRTTVGVWPCGPVRQTNSPGETCANPEYRKYIQELSGRGFEVGYHNTTPHASFREEIANGLEAFANHFGSAPITMANHYNAEAIYWGEDRIGGLRRRLYSAATRGHNRFYGHVEQSPYFWGDLCKSKVRFCRNFTFHNINTLQACPWMPYYDPERDYVNYWFASSNAKNAGSFLELLSEGNQDRLEAEGGACIVYTHFGLGFIRDGEIDSRFRFLMDRLGRKNGWFVPVGTLLDYLLKQRADAAITPQQKRKLEWRWLREKLLMGAA